MGTKARLVVAAVAATVLGVAVASTATGQVPGYTTSTTQSNSTTTGTLPNTHLEIRVALRYKRNQPANGKILVSARCRVAAPYGGAIITGREFCQVDGQGQLLVRFRNDGGRSTRRIETYRLRGDSVKIQPHETKTLVFRYGPKARKHAKSALLRAQRSVDANLFFKFSDAHGNSKSVKRSVHLRKGQQAINRH